MLLFEFASAFGMLRACYLFDFACYVLEIQTTYTHVTQHVTHRAHSTLRIGDFDVNFELIKNLIL
jgi:hypothetical protein